MRDALIFILGSGIAGIGVGIFVSCLFRALNGRWFHWDGVLLLGLAMMIFGWAIVRMIRP